MKDDCFGLVTRFDEGVNVNSSGCARRRYVGFQANFPVVFRRHIEGQYFKRLAQVFIVVVLAGHIRGLRRWANETSGEKLKKCLFRRARTGAPQHEEISRFAKSRSCLVMDCQEDQS